MERRFRPADELAGIRLREASGYGGYDGGRRAGRHHHHHHHHHHD
jgi:hypothetical protein